MGIKFQCHQCRHPMHVKDFLAGKKSRCPTCQTKFRIPAQGELLSIQVTAEEALDEVHATSSGVIPKAIEKMTPVAVSPVAMSPVTMSPVTMSPVVSKPEATASLPVPASSVAVPNVSEPSVPAPIAVASSASVVDTKGMHWFVRPPSGGQFGPASLDILTDWIKQRRVTPESLIWREGWQEWLPANRALPDLFPEFSARPPEAAPIAPPFSPPPVIPPTAAPPFAAILATPGSKESTLAETPVSASQQKALLRLKKKKRKQLQLVGLLSVLAIILVVVLVVVLIWNPAVQPPPGAK